MSRIFVSHSSANDAEVTKLAGWLEGEGTTDLFVDHLHIPAGENWIDRLPKELEKAGILLTLVTRDWLMSTECFAEYRAFYYTNRPVIPLLMSNTLDDLTEEAETRLKSLCASVQGLPCEYLPPDPLTQRLLLGSLTSASDLLRKERRSKQFRMVTAFAGSMVLVLSVLAVNFRAELEAFWDRFIIAHAFSPLSDQAQATLLQVEGLAIEARMFRECTKTGICPEMVALPPGAFRFGSPEDSQPEPSELPAQRIDMGAGLAVSVTEITRAQWNSCYVSTRLRGWPSCKEIVIWNGQSNHPVDSVSWRDAKAYVAWLNQQLFGTINGPYRLLSEVEWEYAAWGTTTPDRQPFYYSWGDDLEPVACRHANALNLEMPDALGIGRRGLDCPNNPTMVSAVKSFEPNAFGIFDTAGNVAEWVEDCWHDSHHNRPAGTQAWTQSAPSNCERVVKGGSWMGEIDNLRPGARVPAPEHLFGLNIGFRVARDLNWIQEEQGVN